MGTARYRDQLARLVEPGERVLAAEKAEIAQGTTPPEPPDAPQSELSRGRPSVLGVLLNMVSPNVVFSAGDRFVDLVLFGVAGRGAPGSHASWLYHLRWLCTVQSGLADTVLAVTDRRLLVCVTGPVKFWSNQQAEERAVAQMKVLWSAPREAVVRARVGWHRLNPKRLRIDFADGSWLAFTVPLAESGRPLRAIAAALSVS